MADNGAAPDPAELLRSTAYLRLLVLAALVGVPVSAIAFFFLKLVNELQQAIFFDSAPAWWPLPVLALSGLLTALAIKYLPGTGGHSPADGFKAGGVTRPIDLPGIVLAALATLSLGAVLGPEAPLILIGAGLGALAVRLAARDAPDTAGAVIAAAGSFAAISSLLGSPLLGAFLLLEASGLGGPMLGIVLVPGLLSAGIGSLIFIGLGSLTGFGTLSLSIPGLPPFDRPTVAMFGYAVAFGLAAPVLGGLIRRGALKLRPFVERRMLLLMPAVGLAIGGLAILFDQASDKGFSEVLFSGQSQLPGLIGQSAAWSVGTLLLLILCKGLAYSLSMSSFRGGPVFPAMFIGAAGGIAASHLPGLPLVPALAMGIGAMCCTMLSLPLTSVLLATLLLSADGVQVMPLAIVAVVVSYVVTERLTTVPIEATEPAPAVAPAARVAASEG